MGCPPRMFYSRSPSAGSRMPGRPRLWNAPSSGAPVAPSWAVPVRVLDLANPPISCYGSHEVCASSGENGERAGMLEYHTSLRGASNHRGLHRWVAMVIFLGCRGVLARYGGECSRAICNRFWLQLQPPKPHLSDKTCSSRCCQHSSLQLARTERFNVYHRIQISSEHLTVESNWVLISMTQPDSRRVNSFRMY